MDHRNNFSLLRKLLGAIGLSPEAMDDIIERINDFLFDKGEKSAGEPALPYIVNKDFLSPAEHNFSVSCGLPFPTRQPSAPK